MQVVSKTQISATGISCRGWKGQRHCKAFFGGKASSWSSRCRGFLSKSLLVLIALEAVPVTFGYYTQGLAVAKCGRRARRLGRGGTGFTGVQQRGESRGTIQAPFELERGREGLSQCKGCLCLNQTHWPMRQLS